MKKIADTNDASPLNPPTRSMTRIVVREVEWTAVRAQGAGGQNVNKVSTAVHLRYDIHASSLPREIKERLLVSRDQRVSTDGVIVLKAQRHRTQERNLEDALARLQAMVDAAATLPEARKATRPTKASKRRRVDTKVRRGLLKSARGRIVDD